MMIYLIDDKKLRQEQDYLWPKERFEQYKSIIKCIYKLEELELLMDVIFSNDNIILFHESFFNQNNIAFELFNKKLNHWLHYSDKNKVVYFSGGKNTREVSDKISNISVSIFYANLEFYLKEILNNKPNLEYLFYGENIHIEKDLKQKQFHALNETFKEDPVNLNGETLFLCSAREYISNPFIKYKKVELFSDVSDEKFTEKISEWFNEKKYDNIFIPLCFGNTLSDFNGLRLATHIRCTSQLNQLSRILIYSFVDLEDLMYNEYFDILKTKNISLIAFSKKSFLEAAIKPEDPLTIGQLPSELKKLKLNVPRNLFDSHSIGNIWGMYRLLELEGIDFKTITSLQNNRNSLNNLYFKYLQTINTSSELVNDSITSSRREYKITLPGLIVKGKIELHKSK